MPTTRRFKTRTSAVPLRVRATLGIGMSTNTLSEDELRQMWRTWGGAMRELYARLYSDREPFVAHIAREKSW